MRMTIKVDMDKTSRMLQRISSRDIPYALARGVSMAARETRDKLKQDIPGIFKHAGPFTRNAISFTYATKQNQTATVFVKDQQEKYLKFEEYGGTRTPQDNTMNPNAKALVIGSPSARRNASGALPKGYVRSLAQKAMDDLKKSKRKNRNIIVKLPESRRGPGGFFQRNVQANSLVRLISFIHHATYKPKFGFFKRTSDFLDRNLNPILQKTIDSILEKGK